MITESPQIARISAGVRSLLARKYASGRAAIPAAAYPPRMKGTGTRRSSGIRMMSFLRYTRKRMRNNPWTRRKAMTGLGAGTIPMP